MIVSYLIQASRYTLPCKMYFWQNFKVKKLKHECTKVNGTEEVQYKRFTQETQTLPVTYIVNPNPSDKNSNAANAMVWHDNAKKSAEQLLEIFYTLPSYKNVVLLTDTSSLRNSVPSLNHRVLLS